MQPRSESDAECFGVRLSMQLIRMPRRRASLQSSPGWVPRATLAHCNPLPPSFKMPLARRASGSDPRVLADPQARAEAPAMLDGTRAVPFVPATARLEHAALERFAGVVPPMATIEPLVAAPLSAHCIDRHPRDRAVRLGRLSLSARTTEQQRDEPARATPPRATSNHSPSGAAFQRVKCFSICCRI
jgi:hypothetical protein